MTLKEKALLCVLGMVGLYVVAILMWFMGQQDAWAASKDKYEKARKRYEAECELIGEKQKWTDAYEREKESVRKFAEGKSTGTTWSRKLEEIAIKHHIQMDTQPGTEIEAGDMLEMPMSVKKWDGALVSLVDFLHELENTDEGMFDEKSLTIRSSKDGYLKGTMELTCAYMRGEEEKVLAEEEVSNEEDETNEEQ